MSRAVKTVESKSQQQFARRDGEKNQLRIKEERKMELFMKSVKIRPLLMTVWDGYDDTGHGPIPECFTACNDTISWTFPK